MQKFVFYMWRTHVGYMGPSQINFLIKNPHLVSKIIKIGPDIPGKNAYSHLILSYSHYFLGIKKCLIRTIFPCLMTLFFIPIRTIVPGISCMIFIILHDFAWFALIFLLLSKWICGGQECIDDHPWCLFQYCMSFQASFVR